MDVTRLTPAQRRRRVSIGLRARHQFHGDRKQIVATPRRPAATRAVSETVTRLIMTVVVSRYGGTLRTGRDERSTRGARTTVSTSALLTDPARSVTRSTSSFFPTANVRTVRARDVGGRGSTRLSGATDPCRANMVCVRGEERLA